MQLPILHAEAGYLARRLALKEIQLRRRVEILALVRESEPGHFGQLGSHTGRFQLAGSLVPVVGQNSIRAARGDKHAPVPGLRSGGHSPGKRT